MKNENKKGGKRPGSGRRPNDVKKEPVTVYTDVSRFGGKEGARIAIYEFLNGKINFTGKSSFVPLGIPTSLQKKFPPSDQEIKQKTPKEQKNTILADLKPQEQPQSVYSINRDNADIFKQIEAIKAEKIPPERNTPFGKKSWQMDQQKRIQELQNKLK